MRSLYKDNRITISSPQAKACLLAAFFLPVLILLFAAWRLHLAPFTDVYYMPNSMQETYLPVISELCHKVKNGESIFFTWNNAGGTSFWNLIACYAASPFTLLYLCFSEADIPKVTQAIFALRCAFASLTFCVLLWKKEKILSPVTVAFSTAYGLSAYMLAFYEEPWYLDTLIFLPLLILGMHYLLQGKKKWLFTFSFAMIIISSWQAGVYVLVFAVALFPLLMMEERKKKIDIRKRAINVKDFALSILIALGMTLIFWFPVLKGILHSSLTDLSFRFPQDLNTNIKIWDTFERFSFDAYFYSLSDSTQYPSVYCGIVSVMLVFFYGLSERIPFKEKLYSFSALLFFYVIMANRLLSFLFSGAHYPISSTYPQAFLIVFLVMYLGGRALGHGALTENHKNLRIVTALLLSFLVINCAISTSVNYSDHKVYYVVCFIVVYFAVISLLEKKNTKEQNRFLSLVFAGILLVEGTIALYHPLKDRYMVRSMKDAIVDPEENPMPESMRKTLSTNQKTEWVYRLNSAVTYHKPDEQEVARVQELVRQKEPYERVVFDSTTEKNIGLIYHVPSLDSAYFIQSKAFVSALKALGMSNASGKIKVVKNVPWLEKLFAVSGRVNDEGVEKGQETGSIGYFTSSEMIYESLDGKLPAFENQNQFTGLFSEGKVLERLDYSIEKLTNVQNLKEDRFKVVSSPNMNEAEFTVKADFISPIYIICNCEQQAILEVTQYDSDGGALNSESITDAHKRVFVLDSFEEGADHLSIHLEFPENKTETIRFSASSLNRENLEKLEQTLGKTSFRITSFSAAQVEGDISAPSSGNLLFTIPYDNSWSITIDGEKTKPFAGCKAFLAVHLTAGEHHVSMKYEPPQYKTGLISLGVFSLLAVFVALSGGTLGRKKKDLNTVQTEEHENVKGNDN